MQLSAVCLFVCLMLWAGVWKNQLFICLFIVVGRCHIFLALLNTAELCRTKTALLNTAEPCRTILGSAHTSICRTVQNLNSSALPQNLKWFCTVLQRQCRSKTVLHCLCRTSAELKWFCSSTIYIYIYICGWSWSCNSSLQNRGEPNQFCTASAELCRTNLGSEAVQNCLGSARFCKLMYEQNLRLFCTVLQY